MLPSAIIRTTAAVILFVLIQPALDDVQLWIIRHPPDQLAPHSRPFVPIQIVSIHIVRIRNVPFLSILSISSRPTRTFRAHIRHVSPRRLARQEERVQFEKRLQRFPVRGRRRRRRQQIRAPSVFA